MAHCNQCEADWQTRVERPVQCPRCHRVDWAEPKKARSVIHVSEVREFTPADMEAMPKPAGPSIMAEGFPVTIPAPKRCAECKGVLPYHQKGCSKR